MEIACRWDLTPPKRPTMVRCSLSGRYGVDYGAVRLCDRAQGPNSSCVFARCLHLCGPASKQSDNDRIGQRIHVYVSFKGDTIRLTINELYSSHITLRTRSNPRCLGAHSSVSMMLKPTEKGLPMPGSEFSATPISYSFANTHEMICPGNIDPGPPPNSVFSSMAGWKSSGEVAFATLSSEVPVKSRLSLELCSVMYRS